MNGSKRYAIVRIHKLNKLKKIEHAEKHNSRLITVANADIDKTKQNVEFLSGDALCVRQRIKDTLKSFGIVDPAPRSILGFEMILTYSHEVDDIDPRQWALDSLDWVEKRFLKGTIVYAVLHLDEKTPHLHVIVVPIVEYKGKRNFTQKYRLNFRELFGGDFRDGGEKMSAFQTAYAEEVGKQYNLERGVKGSKRVHIPQKKLYRLSAMSREEAEKFVVSILAALKNYRHSICAPDPRHIATPQSRDEYRIRQQLDFNATVAGISENLHSLVKCAEKGWLAYELERERVEFAKENGVLREKIADLEKFHSDAVAKYEREIISHNAELASLRNRYRAVTVLECIKTLTGMFPIPGKNQNLFCFTLPGGQKVEVNTVTDEFQNLTPDHPGKLRQPNGHGAIDAVIFFTGCSQHEAIVTIGDLLGAERASATLVESLRRVPDSLARRTRRSFSAEMMQTLIPRDPERWDALVTYLESRYGLDKAYLEQLHGLGHIYANPFGHLVTRKTGHGSARLMIQDVENPATGFWHEPNDGLLVIGSLRTKRKILVVEEPIQALQIDASRPRTSQNATILVVGRRRSKRKSRSLHSIAEKFDAFVISPLGDSGEPFLTWMKSVIPTVRELSQEKIPSILRVKYDSNVQELREDIDLDHK